MNNMKEIPVGDLIEKLPSSLGGDGSTCLNMTDREKQDCLDAIETLKHVHPLSIPHIFKIVALFLALGPLNTMMLQEALKGSTLTETSIYMGTSKQNAHQRWGRVVEAFPQLERIYNKRRRLKNDSSR